MEKTAVEFIFDAVYRDITFSELLGIIAQAKIMEKQQDKNKYSEEDVRGMLEDMSRYVSTKEMRDDFVGVGYSEWVRKRDWFVNHLIEQFKKK